MASVELHGCLADRERLVSGLHRITLLTTALDSALVESSGQSSWRNIMSIVVRFAPQSVTTEKYDQTVKRFDEAFGEGFMPDGCEMHVAFVDSDGNVRVSEIWDSREKFEAFGEKLGPLLAEAGIDAGQPEVFEVHRLDKR